MTIQELGVKLADMYGTAGEKSTSMIHLFGVIYAEQIEAAGSNASEIVRAAGLPDSYKTEIRKGVNLAKWIRSREGIWKAEVVAWCGCFRSGVDID